MTTAASWVKIDPELARGAGVRVEPGAAKRRRLRRHRRAAGESLGLRSRIRRLAGCPDAGAIEAARARVGWRKVEVDAGAASRPQAARACASTCRRSARAAASTGSRSTSTRRASLTTSSTCRASCARAGHNARGERVAAWPWSSPRPMTLRRAATYGAGGRRAARRERGDGRRLPALLRKRRPALFAHHRSAHRLRRWRTLRCRRRRWRPTCMQADALATVLMVMEPAAALASRRDRAHTARC